MIIYEVNLSISKTIKDSFKVWLKDHAESMITLGLIGTVTGFIIMLGGAFADLDLTNIGQAKEVIRDMAAGMSTALTTTLVGLVCSIITKLQLMNLEYDHRKA